MIDVEWDPAKEESNIRKHGVSFREASSVFADPLSLTIESSTASSPEELRSVTLGESATGRLLVVVHADRGDRLRIISARRPSRREIQTYESR